MSFYCKPLTLRIIAKECQNNKTNIFYCFIDFKKSFDTMPKNNLGKILKHLKVSFQCEFSIVGLRLY